MNEDEVMTLKARSRILGDYASEISSQTYKIYHDWLFELEEKYPTSSWKDFSAAARKWLGVLVHAGLRESISDLKEIVSLRAQVVEIMGFILDQINEDKKK